MGYDSRPDTYAHILQVQRFMGRVVTGLLARAIGHDQSKLVEPEVSVFDEYTPKLAALTYGSDEYKESLDAIRSGALDHHYANNSHHPEHYPDGIQGMSLLDIIEMFCDWKAATLRHDDGDLRKSIEINQERFGYSDELKQIFINTALELGMFEDD